MVLAIINKKSTHTRNGKQTSIISDVILDKRSFGDVEFLSDLINNSFLLLTWLHGNKLHKYICAR